MIKAVAPFEMLAVFNQQAQHHIPGDNNLNSTVIWLQQAAVTANPNIH
jgi:hypothetical protein